MKIGFVGLGRMGANMVERLTKAGHDIVAFDLNESARTSVAAKGATVVEALADVIPALTPSRVVWVMVPAGRPTQETVELLAQNLDEGDIVIDGGNSNYNQTRARAALLKEKGIHFLDAGTSGGVWGLTVGYCLMIGGEADAFKVAEPLFQALAPKEGYLHVGPSGSGHFVKMIHNGIEYAMLQAYAEGFEILNAKKEFDLDLKAVSHLWNQGSVIRSWLLELAEGAFDKDPKLAGIRGYVEDSGEGRWTVEESIQLSVPAPVIALSLLERFRSRQDESFSAKVIAALRNEFGGHAVKSTQK
jgi:6-phosphogluconate dehydrogenase